MASWSWFWRRVSGFSSLATSGRCRSQRHRSETEQAPLVDERPLQTARSLAKLAAGQDERKFAERAAELADNEVDLAFHDALRDAANHPVARTPQNRELYEHASQSEAQVKADQDRIEQLKKQLAATSGSHHDNVQEQLDVAQAQLELDQDEAADAKEDLIRSGADPGSLIQRQFDQHQAAEHSADEKPAAASNPAINYQADNLWVNSPHGVRCAVARGHLSRRATKLARLLQDWFKSTRNWIRQVKAAKTKSTGQPATASQGPIQASVQAQSNSAPSNSGQSSRSAKPRDPPNSHSQSFASTFR